MGTNEQLSHTLSDWVCILNNAKKCYFFIQMLLYLADLYFYSLSIRLCCYNHSFEFIYENINCFLSNAHIWRCRNLNSHISQTHSDILFIFPDFLWNTFTDKRLKTKPIKLSKFAFSAVGLFRDILELYCSSCLGISPVGESRYLIKEIYSN